MRPDSNCLSHNDADSEQCMKIEYATTHAGVAELGSALQIEVCGATAAIIIWGKYTEYTYTGTCGHLLLVSVNSLLISSSSFIIL